jgi:hypothetical protein
MAFINNVAKKLRLQPFSVMPKYNADHLRREAKKHLKDCIYPSPSFWLRAFMDVEMTIMDSFNGMVFSIIINKPFWVIGNKKRGLSRFHSLLSTFDLKSRLICVEDIDNDDISAGVD